MLLLQILSFGGLLKCGLISEWGGGGVAGVGVLNHYPKVSQHFHTLVLTIAGGNDTTAYTVDYIRFRIGLMFCSDAKAFISNK